MKVFLVGGAIRDELLGIPFNEKDWVVVNSSHKEMIKQGFKQGRKKISSLFASQNKRGIRFS
jgi:tRNA nucleotidyltransferase/poly(A) polymerase